MSKITSYCTLKELEEYLIGTDYHVLENGKTIAHKSCKSVNNGNFTNCKRVFTVSYYSLDECIRALKHRCEIIDQIEENTYLIDCKLFNNFRFYLSDSTHNPMINLIKNKIPCLCICYTADEFIEFLTKNHPECIRSNDIKIALK